jgi:hypothetical protein
MKAAENERRELLDRQGPLTARQVAAYARRTEGLAKVRKILDEPVDPDTVDAGLKAARRALQEALDG